EAARSPEADTVASAEAAPDTVAPAEPAVPTGMVAVPGGRYPLGCQPGDARCWDDEKPGIVSALDPFGVMREEVTVVEYEACVETGTCPPAGRASTCTAVTAPASMQPVTCVPWEAARAYCGWRGWRLPTEAEWEVAARGPEHPDYPWGDDAPTCERAVLGGRGAYCAPRPREVASAPEDRSWVGALDMGGNVREWTASTLTPYGQPAAAGEADAKRVCRGGSWRMKTADAATAHTRGEEEPGAERDDIGFRCVVSL
ncbi:MAG: hypothetical protein EP329_20115, partial [Deltaproteobacteria bacterium]